MARLVAIGVLSCVCARSASGQQPFSVQPGTVVRFTTDSLAIGESSPYYRTALLLRLQQDSIVIQARASNEVIPLRAVRALYVQQGFEPRSTRSPVIIAAASAAALMTYVALSWRSDTGLPTGVLLSTGAIGLGTGLLVSHLWPPSAHWVAAWPPGIAGTTLPR